MDNLLEKLRPHWLPILLGVAGMMFLGYGLIALSSHKSDKPDILFESARTQSDPGSAEDKKTATITIDVEGAVERPGVYELPAGARLQDALIAAGGMSKDADREKVSKGLNLAAKLIDGGKIYIPVVGDNSALAGVGSAGSTVLGAETGEQININSASSGELDKLQGVGPVTAEKIIGSRPYGSVEELVSKKVVSQKVFDQIKEKISVY